MQIDWLTVGAQVVNFLILVVLLRRFLYRPVLAAMDRREQRIAAALQEAERREREAEARGQALAAAGADLERQRHALLAGARDDADAERRRLLDEVRAEVERQRTHVRVQLEQEWDDQRHALTGRLAAAATDATRRALSDLADADLEHAIARTFCHRLAALDEATRAAVADAAAGQAVVSTTFEPDPATARLVADAVREHLGREATFVQAHDLVAGIEVRVGGWKLSWTVAEYLRDLETELERTVVAGVRPPER